MAMTASTMMPSSFPLTDSIDLPVIAVSAIFMSVFPVLGVYLEGKGLR